MHRKMDSVGKKFAVITVAFYQLALRMVHIGLALVMELSGFGVLRQGLLLHLKLSSFLCCRKGNFCGPSNLTLVVFALCDL